MLKFSGSPIQNGKKNDVQVIVNASAIIVTRSLVEKNGWKKILSIFGLFPVGLLDPVIWREARWIITINAKINGIKKWREKNRFKVAFLIENPPHNHSTICLPIYGIADTKLVITVAPQKDICPHGRT